MKDKLLIVVRYARKKKKKSSYMYSEIVIYNVHYESMIMAMSSLTFSLLVLKLREAQATINWYYQQDGVPIQYKGSGSISIISDEGKRLSHIIVSVKTLYQHACLCKLNGLVYELYAKAWLILIAIGTMHHHSTIPFNPSLSLSLSLMIGSIEKEHLFVIGTTKLEQLQIGFNYNFLGEINITC